MIDITRMRVKVRKAIGENEPDSTVSDDDIDEYLNLAFWEVQDKFPFREKERSGNFSTVIGQRDYKIPSPFECLLNLSVVDPKTLAHHPLTQMFTDEYEQKYIEGAANYRTPEKYIREQCFARLWPTPDQVYSIFIKRKIVLTDLSDANPVISIPQVWNEVIIYGGIWRAFIEEQGDFARAKEVKQHQVQLMGTIIPTEVKELKDNPRAGLDVLGRDYDMREPDEDHFRPRRWSDR